MRLGKQYVNLSVAFNLSKEETDLIHSWKGIVMYIITQSLAGKPFSIYFLELMLLMLVLWIASTSLVSGIAGEQPEQTANFLQTASRFLIVFLLH